MTIARDDLGGDRLGSKAEAARARALDVRRQVRVRPDRARDLADGDLLARGGEPATTAHELGEVTGEDERRM